MPASIESDDSSVPYEKEVAAWQDDGEWHFLFLLRVRALIATFFSSTIEQCSLTGDHGGSLVR